MNSRVGSIADQITTQDLRKEVQNILSTLGAISSVPVAALTDEQERFLNPWNINKVIKQRISPTSAKSEDSNKREIFSANGHAEQF